MNIQTELLQLKCESMGSFLTRVNQRASELGEALFDIQFLGNNHTVFAIFKLKCPDAKETEKLIEKYLPKTKEDGGKP